MGIKEKVRAILSQLPPGVTLVAATKTRSPEEILKAAEGGIEIVGENYAQEAEAKYQVIGNRVNWHFIGHPQRNKIRKLVRFIDMIETVDSLEIASEIEKRCALLEKVMPVLVEINSGREPQKAGVLPEEADGLIKEISKYPHLRVMGLMTMGPMFGDPEDSRPYFVETRKVFERIKSLQIPNVETRYLSMGMTNSYKVAIEEGANIVRIGTKIFGSRE